MRRCCLTGTVLRTGPPPFFVPDPAPTHNDSIGVLFTASNLLGGKAGFFLDLRRNGRLGASAFRCDHDIDGYIARTDTGEATKA
jgi:hypothetical protein